MIALGRASSLSGRHRLRPWRQTDGCAVVFRAGLRSPAARFTVGAGAAALPGAGGLVILTAFGVRVGYRQAKAGFVVRAAGIARFAGPGPLGVVRSGSLVSSVRGSLRVVRPGALSAGCVLDKVA